MAASVRHVIGGLRTESAQPIATTTAPPPARPQPPAAAPPAHKLQPATKTKTMTKKNLLQTPRGIFSVVAAAALILGWILPTHRYITPQRGVGYWLGIVGGSMMLILLLYSGVKRVHWFKFLGPVLGWFRFHMVLGILGPLCILYHCNFGLGAANSNVAFFCMVTVAGSGLIGRYLYAHIHQGLYGRKLSLEELQAGADGLRTLNASISFLPELVGRLETLEKRLLAVGPHAPLLGFLKPAVVAMMVLTARGRLHRYIRNGLRQAIRLECKPAQAGQQGAKRWKPSVVAAERERLCRAAYAYVDKRLLATRRVAEFQGFERLFSLWHAVHLPLMFIMIVAGIVHVIAVHVY